MIKFGKSSKIAILIAVLAFLWILSGVFSKEDKKTVGGLDGQDDLVSVVVLDSLASEIYPKMQITGTTAPLRSVDISAEVSGQIIDLPSDEGQDVGEGQILAKIERVDKGARVMQAKYDVEHKKMQYSAAKNLTGSGFNSKTRLAEAKADLEAAKAKLKAAEYALAKTSIAAPFDGIISKRFVEIGDYVAPPQKLFSIATLDPIIVRGFASEGQLSGLEVGEKVEIKLFDGREVQGKLTFVSPLANEDSRTFRLEVTAPNEGNKIAGGLTATIMFAGAKEMAHKITPAALTLSDTGDIGVRVVGDDGIVDFMPIRIVQDTPKFVWVSGLPYAVKIIAVGQEFVTKGQKVSFVRLDEQP